MKVQRFLSSHQLPIAQTSRDFILRNRIDQNHGISHDFYITLAETKSGTEFDGIVRRNDSAGSLCKMDTQKANCSSEKQTQGHSIAVPMTTRVLSQ